jgi:hypothetical protein
MIEAGRLKTAHAMMRQNIWLLESGMELICK